MRKLFTLALIALLALALSMTLMSCGQRESTTTTEETPPAETPPMETMMPDTTAVDTTMQH